MRDRLADIPEASGIRKAAGLVFARADIGHAHYELSAEAFARRDWYSAVKEATVSLARRTLHRMEADGTPPDRCDAFITVSSSHAGFPSLSRELQEDLGFPLDARVFDLSGAGCSGPAQGLQLAHLLLGAGSAKRVCLLCVDVMGSHGQLRRFEVAPPMEELVAHCLASDGAAAMVLSTEAGPYSSHGGFESHEVLWSNALDQNFFGASADNEPYLAVGKDIRSRIVGETSAWFEARSADEVVLMHPGGAALMDRVAQAEPGRAASIELSRKVLRENGNLGSPSVLFVLKEAFESGLPLGTRFTLFALGPGIVTTSGTFLEVRAPE